MIPVDFEGTNVELTQTHPHLREANALQTRCLAAQNPQDGQYFILAWKPSREDLDAMLDGREIYAKVFTATLYPIMLFTLDDDGNPNQ